MTKRKGAVYLVSLVDAPAGDGKPSLCDILAQPWGEQYFKAKLLTVTSYSAALSTGPEPIMRSMRGIEPKLPDYIWKGRIARGEIATFSGDPGVAKSFLMFAIAADLTRGRVPITGERCKPVRFLYASPENDPEHTIAARFQAMGVNVDNFLLLEGERDANVDASVTLADVRSIEKAVIKGKIDVLILDPLQSYFGEGADSHKATEVRPRMDALMKLAKRQNIGVVIIRHLAKAASGRAIHRGMGSIDFSAAVRIEFMVGHRADNPNDRAIITVKNNLGKYAPALSFSIDGEDLKARLKWNGESDMRLADLTAPEAASKSAKTKVAQCEGYLLARLAKGPVKLADLVKENLYDLRTLQRAAERIGVTRTGSKRERNIEWALQVKTFARGQTPNTEGR